ncbi:MAG: stage 0 sporulation family protein [Oscillospiraceae bacterium]|nr:stage 0 sporulation family protein [Oscillospiraceae bacterium]
MATVVGVRFRNAGKLYYFDPGQLWPTAGDAVIVETVRGVEYGEVVTGVSQIADELVTPPLKNVLRIATAEDARHEAENRAREPSAMAICAAKIAAHQLPMKLVGCEYTFDDTKLLFYFTSDKRVDFRALVKDLASAFHARIELRQIGVRDEAKMLGGIGICGRPYCCHQFLEDFQPVSTKMAKVQSLSLNPTKISGSCGRLMCCLRYEQDAYEDLIKKVPKQGAFVETKDGYGTAVSVNLLRQTVKVRLDDDREDALHLYTANELCAVPGGRPKDGEEPPHVLNYVPPVPEEEEEETVDEWAVPVLVVPEPSAVGADEDGDKRARHSRRSRRGGGKAKSDAPAEKRAEPAEAKAAEKSAEAKKSRRHNTKRPEKNAEPKAHQEQKEKKPHAKPGAKAVKVETRQPQPAPAKAEGEAARKPRRHYHKPRPKA